MLSVKVNGTIQSSSTLIGGSRIDDTQGKWRAFSGHINVGRGVNEIRGIRLSSASLGSLVTSRTMSILSLVIEVEPTGDAKFFEFRV